MTNDQYAWVGDLSNVSLSGDASFFFFARYQVTAALMSRTLKVLERKEP